jgi:AcrR family transcriptional regulator
VQDQITVSLVEDHISGAESAHLATSRSHVPRTRVDPKDPKARRAAILDGALELFAIQGYRATTMADVGKRAGIRGPSIYKYFASKNEILSEIMLTSMNRLIENYAVATAKAPDPAEQLKLAVEAHVRYHTRHRLEAFVGTREINSLKEPVRARLLARRDAYERGFREIVERGRIEGTFQVSSSRLASYAILDMGIGISVWFREDGPLDEDQVARHYGITALRIVGVIVPT